MNPFIYQKVFVAVMATIAVIAGGMRLSSPDSRYKEVGSSLFLPIALSFILVFWIGLRPVSVAFGDTVIYASGYSKLDPHHVTMDWSSEWVWQWLMNGCKAAGLSTQMFFFIVAAGYILSALYAIYRFMPSDPMLGVIFLFCSLMFFPFAVNGLRNGLACHLVLLGACFLLDDKWIIGSLLCLIALGIHRSVMLPIAVIFVSILFLRNVRLALVFWVASIFISLLAGNAVSEFFSGLGFDDRMTQYINIEDMSEFSRVGFRWDFLLYSAAPVVMAWYVCIRRECSDNWYNVLCTVYLLCNAFWIMVIRAAFSNRFAYLSWFLYPIVIAYPLVNCNIREDQDSFTGWVLLAYAGFSVFMWFIFW
jgi:hypothetical protein